MKIYTYNLKYNDIPKFINVTYKKKKNKNLFDEIEDNNEFYEDYEDIDGFSNYYKDKSNSYIEDMYY